MKNPQIIKNIFSEEDFKIISDYFKNHKFLKNIAFDENGRRGVGDKTDQILNDYSEKLLPIAKSFFKSDSLKQSYTLFTEYSAKNINLPRHTDANACTYTIDLVVYQDRPWGLWIEGKEYIANEGEAIFFWGEEQEHWREEITRNDNVVAVIFFHYVEPDHWFFTKGPEYLEEIKKIKRKQMGL